MLKIEDLLPEPSELKKLAKRDMKRRVKAIRSGKVIKRKYADSTAKRRRRYGLRVDRVNLTGNRRYSRKSWRLLDSWRVNIKDRKTVVITWTRQEAATIYDAHVRRYGEFLRMRN